MDTRCEGCNREIATGEPVLIHEGGEVDCKGCALTWGEALEEWGKIGPMDADTTERHSAFMDAYMKHINNGGAATDKLVPHVAV